MRYPFHTRYTLALLLLLLCGCNSSPAWLPSGPTATPTLTPTPTSTPTPTPTPTPSPTPTPLPLITAPLDRLPLYTLDIALDYAGNRLEVIQRVLWVNDSPDAWSEVVFSVPPAYYGLLTLTQSEVTTTWETRPAPYTLEGTMLHIPLPVPVAPNEPVLIHLAYALAIPPVAPYAWPPTGNLGAGDRLIQVGDWYPALVPYRPGVGWLTWDYVPVGDPTIYSLSNFDVQLFADESVIVAAPGLVSQEDRRRRYHLERARTFAFLASPEYQIAEGMTDGIPIHAYYLPEHAAAGQAVVDIAVKSISFFSDIYGPYPYPELILAENAYYGAMEYSGLVSMTGAGYQGYVGNASDLLVALTAHEIAHQWWFGAVGDDQVHEPWLDEAFAKYSEVLYYERYQPELVAWWWQASVDRWTPSGPVDATIYTYGDSVTYIHDVYGQGAHFLADLRTLIGDEAFFSFLMNYRLYGDGRIVTREDFFTVLRRYTDVDLTPLIAAYFATP